MLMDLETLDWDDSKGGMLETFGIEKECLPAISKSSCADFGIIQTE